MFLLLVLVGVVLIAPSLNDHWFSDDLYLVRPYSEAQLVEPFRAGWVPGFLATPGYRPLTPLFFHVSHLIAADSPSAYRLEAVILFALMLIALALAALELGFSRWQVTIACLIILCTRNTWWMLAWPSDAVRTFMALFGNLALYFHLRFLRTKRRSLMVLALLCFAVALLTREEVLPYALLIPLIGFWHDRDRRQALRFGAALAGMSVIFFIARRVFVPDAVSTLFVPGWLPQISFAVAPLLFNWTPIIGFVLLWLLIALARPRRTVFFWLLCVVIAALPGIIVWRGNNSLLPVTFMALFLVAVFSQRRALHLAALTLYLLGSVVAHRAAQLGLAPQSSERVSEARRFLYGDLQVDLPWIPADRLDQVRADADRTDITPMPPIWSGW